jgi:hypothetical protein
LARKRPIAARFANIDHATTPLLPPDLREWIGADHMVHFIMDAVAALDLTLARLRGLDPDFSDFRP